MSNPYLSQIERGVKKPSAEILSQIAKGLRISAETLYVRAGILDDHQGSDVVAAILADVAIGERHKRTLIDVYESFRAEHAAEPPAAAGHQGAPRRSHEGQPRRRPTAQEDHRQEDHRKEEEHLMTLTTITRSKPFYVAAGVTDAAVKPSCASVPAKLSTVKVERRDIEKAVATVQVEVVSLPARAQATAVGIAGDVTGRVDAVYGDMLVRGRKVVGRIRRQKSTQDLKKQATTTVRRTKATGTSAKKSAAETAQHREAGHQAHHHGGQEAGRHDAQHRQGRHHVGPQDQQSAAKATTAGASKVGQ